MKGLTWRVTVVIATVLFSLYLLFPTYLKFSTGSTKQISRVVKEGDPWYYHVFPAEVLKLGLDLMGGLHLVLGIDFDEVNRDAVTKLKNQLKDIFNEEKIDGISVETTKDEKILVNFPSEEVWKKADAAIGKHFSSMIDFDNHTANTATLRISESYRNQVRDHAIDQTLETLRNRIDEFGIAEPIIQRHGAEKVLIQFPGVSEPGRLKEIIARTAKLSFQVVRTGPEEPNGSPTQRELMDWVAKFEKEKGLKPDPLKPMSDFLKQINAYLGDKLPKNTELLFHKKVDPNTKGVDYVPYLLDREALVTGEDLQDAYYSFEQQKQTPIVNFQLNPQGAIKFEKATGENVRKYMAIVLDGNVHSAPLIRQRIGGGRAMIEMGDANGMRSSQDILADAKDTALVLRSGALPARLQFLEERVIGPSLGADAIRAGTISLAAGLGLVFIFMGIYYRLSGVIAGIALFLNGLFVVACMAAFEGTLTLPGLAGLTLTLGMAVDANVLIFEHIREELRAGKSALTAVSEGYHRAFSAILDGHVTTILAGLVLLQFGYGPIRGFAVTLLIGLVASMYTSIFVTRVIFDSLVVSKERKTLSV